MRKTERKKKKRRRRAPANSAASTSNPDYELTTHNSDLLRRLCMRNAFGRKSDDVADGRSAVLDRRVAARSERERNWLMKNSV